MQETRGWFLVQKGPTCVRAAKPVCQYWACALEPRGCSYWNPCALWLVLCIRREDTTKRAFLLHLESGPSGHNQRKAHAATKASTAKNKWMNKNYFQKCWNMSDFRFSIRTCSHMCWKSPPVGWSNLHLHPQCERDRFPCLCSDLIESDFKGLADLISERRQLIPFLFCLSLDSRDGFRVLISGTFSPVCMLIFSVRFL